MGPLLAGMFGRWVLTGVLQWACPICPHRCAACVSQQVCLDRCALMECFWEEPGPLGSLQPGHPPCPLPTALPEALSPRGADPDPPRPSSGLTKGEEGQEKSQRFVLSRADSGASDCQARLAVFNHFISVLGSPGRQPVLSSLLRKTSGRVAQRRLRAPIISCALPSAPRSLPREPVKN